jgi:hypothetical protein
MEDARVHALAEIKCTLLVGLECPHVLLSESLYSATDQLIPCRKNRKGTNEPAIAKDTLHDIICGGTI